MSDLRFAVITTVILTFAYMTALSVTSLDRVLAFVGSTGSTSISFILPGLFYYKISDPDSTYHQRLAKEDDDMEDSGTSDVEESAALAQSVTSVRSGVSVASNLSTRSNRGSWRWRKKWRWDLEHIEHSNLRRMSLALAIYGAVVMAVCLALNIFFAVTR
ncbi:hypothetical protein ACJ41O_008643 [Fusarium nematophilum]